MARVWPPKNSAYFRRPPNYHLKQEILILAVTRYVCKKMLWSIFSGLPLTAENRYFRDKICKNILTPDLTTYITFIIHRNITTQFIKVYHNSPQIHHNTLQIHQKYITSTKTTHFESDERMIRFIHYQLVIGQFVPLCSYTISNLLLQSEIV